MRTTGLHSLGKKLIEFISLRVICDRIAEKTLSPFPCGSSITTAETDCGVGVQLP